MNLRPKTNETSPTMAIMTVLAIAVGGYFGYATAFPSDRKQVRSEPPRTFRLQSVVCSEQLASGQLTYCISKRRGCLIFVPWLKIAE